MSQDKATQTDESGSNDFSDLDISDLRKYCKLFGISAQRDWKKEDFVRAIQAKQLAAKYTQLAEESTSSDGQSKKSTLQPGQARILIHRDPTPGHTNSAVPIGLNGRMFLAPRGVECVMPIEYVQVLADAVTRVTRQKQAPSLNNPEGVIVEEDIASYPYQVLDMVPHTKESSFKSNLDQRGALYKRREAFWKDMGKWPTTGELMEWEKDKRQDKILATRQTVA